MALVIVTTELDPKFFKLGEFFGYQIDRKDYKAKVAVADIYKYGGRELKAEELAQSLELFKIKSEIKVPDLFATENGALVVSQPMKEMIESADPNIHQFNQIKLTNNSKPLSEKSWYILNVWQRFNSIDKEESATKETKGFDGKVRTKIVLRKKKISLLKDLSVNFNIWRDEEFPEIMFVKDALADSMNKQAFLKFATKFQTS